MTPADALKNLETALECVLTAQAVLGKNREIWEELLQAGIHLQIAINLANEALDAAKGARG